MTVDELCDAIAALAADEGRPAEDRIKDLLDVYASVSVELTRWPNRGLCGGCGGGIVDWLAAPIDPNETWSKLCPKCAETK